MAQVYDRSQTKLLRSTKRQPNVLARHKYLVHKMPYLSTADRVLARDPDARLFVHAGYAHIDKATGRLGNTEPIAVKLAKLTGMELINSCHGKGVEGPPPAV